ncbi:PREDICTED: membrane magnesium transporter [Populus euphratica]|uniref:Membrane magnesium transporter n=1 Tax=Populus euphratica TaxID=75702 RepID=A0AAJ6TW70_POPEU|nr:PREDICTED: membrane magnesium transporter [Populus euphratica]
MGFSVGFVIGLVGVLILSHAAYSTSQYRGLLKITEDEFSGPPFSVVVELIVGLVLCMWAALTVPGNFLSIHPHSDENRMVSLPDNLDFMIFNHRGKVFVPEINMKLKH